MTAPDPAPALTVAQVIHSLGSGGAGPCWSNWPASPSRQVCGSS